MSVRSSSARNGHAVPARKTARLTAVVVFPPPPLPSALRLEANIKALRAGVQPELRILGALGNFHKETDSMARDVLGALRTIGVGPAVLVGHSLGGAVAFAAALQEPGRIRALALVDPALVGMPAPVSEMRRNDHDGDGASGAVGAIRRAADGVQL